MNITDIKIDEADDWPEVGKFFTYLLEHFGTGSITAEQFKEAVDKIEYDNNEDKDHIWDYFRDVAYEGDIIDNDREKCVETRSFGERVGTCKINKKPYTILFTSCWQNSPYFSLEETMSWSQWDFTIIPEEIFNEKNPASGLVNLTRKPQYLCGFILTNKNVEDFVKFVQNALPEYNVIHDKKIWNCHEGYMTKSHTRVLLEIEAPEGKDLGFMPDHRRYQTEVRVGNFHYIARNTDGYPFLTWITKEEMDKDYDIQR